MIAFGDRRVEVYARRKCDACGEEATSVLTYLLSGARSNPASAGYGRDDVSHSADFEAFACEAHVDEMMRSAPPGYEWCARFWGERALPRLGYWRTISEPS